MYESGREPAGVPVEGGAAYDAGLVEERECPFDDLDDRDAPPLPEDVEFGRPTAGEWLVAACGQVAGVDLLGSLDQVAVADLDADGAVTLLQQMQRFTSYAAGVESQLRARVTAKVITEIQAQFAADGAADRPQYVSPEQVAWSEVAAALRCAPRTGESRILEAQELTAEWRPMLDGMLAGTITLDHARAIGRQLRNLPGYGSSDAVEAAEYVQHCAEILEQVVPFAATHTAGEAGRKTRVLVTAIDPVGARKRRRKAAEQDHGVFLNPVEPGTSEIRAVMPTAHAEAVMQAVTTLARDDRFEVADGCITMGQRRVAALVALMLGDPGSVGQVTGPVGEAKIAVHVNVLVPLDTIIGCSEQGGRIGTTPCTADEVRDLLAQAALGSSTIRRLITDSTGGILDAGRRHYLASDLQRLVIKLRDGCCRFPGCSRPAERCEIDHARPYDTGGNTDLDNLGPLCKYHHQLKTHCGWQIIASHRDGSCTWRSPLGRIYEHTPPDLVPPRPPDDPPPF
ncbi:MAG: DUF222 domain-containing protein [Candidatus Nanopelagicales bacterium]